MKDGRVGGLNVMAIFVTTCKDEGVRHILQSVQLSNPPKIHPIVFVLESATDDEFAKIAHLAVQAFKGCDLVIRKVK